MAGNRRKRIWRRVGWGALIMLAVIIIAAAVALWLGPPRDPKSFALDDEDFGLGFRVGDPWDLDAFEAAMKSKGFVLGTRSNVEDFAKSLEPQGFEKEDFPFFSFSWITNDGCLDILLLSDNKGSTARLSSIHLTSSLPSAEWGWEKTKAYWRKAKEKLAKSGSKQQLTDFIAEAGARETALRYPQTMSGEGVTFASSLDSVKKTYGKPVMELPFAPGSPILCYFGDHQGVTFFFSNERVASITLTEGYRGAGLAGSAGIWYAYLSSPFIDRLIERGMSHYKVETSENNAIS